MVPPMKVLVIACLIATMSSANAQTAPSPAPAPAPLRARLSDEAIRDAIKQTLSEQKKDPALQTGRALSGDRYDQFGRDFSDAKIPDCLHSDGLKFQPTYIFGGLLAAPFVAIAALRGKCR
jgi:hypothetical protein